LTPGKSKSSQVLVEKGRQSHPVVTKALGDGVWSLEKSKKQEKESWRGRKTEKGRLEE